MNGRDPLPPALTSPFLQICCGTQKPGLYPWKFIYRSSFSAESKDLKTSTFGKPQLKWWLTNRSHKRLPRMKCLFILNHWWSASYHQISKDTLLHEKQGPNQMTNNKQLRIDGVATSRKILQKFHNFLWDIKYSRTINRNTIKNTPKTRKIFQIKYILMKTKMLIKSLKNNVKEIIEWNNLKKKRLTEQDRKT